MKYSDKNPVPGVNKEKLKILIVDLSLKYGGASTRAVSIARSLSPWDCAIVGIRKSPVVLLSETLGIPVREVGFSRIDPFIPFRLAKIIRSENIDIIDTQNIQSKFWVSITRLFVRFSFVSTVNSDYKLENGRSWKSYLYNLIDTLTNSKVDRYIAVSDAIKKRLIKNAVQEDLIDLNRNSIDIDQIYINSHLDVSVIREDIGISSDEILFVLVGRLVWAKGFDDFIRSFEIVVKHFRNVKAVIVGEGGLRESLENQIEELGLKDYITLMGYKKQSEVFDVLRAGDIYVISSRSEGIPYSLLEAAAVGLPIITTNCGGIPEVVKDNETAIVVPVGDPFSLSKAILTLCADRDFAKQLGDAAQSHIKKYYSLSAQTFAIKESYLQAYRNGRH